jgi:hypothetical protein
LVSFSKCNAALPNIIGFVLQYPVEEVLLRHDKGVVKGPDVVAKLKDGQMFSREERIFMIKVLAKYLMEKSTV